MQATKMYEDGMSLLSLQKRLGYSSPQSTQVYTKVADSNVKEKYNRAIDNTKDKWWYLGTVWSFKRRLL